MTKAALFLSTILLAACVAFAQGYESTDSSQSTASTNTQNETLRGCLSKGGSDYFLTTLGANPERYEITGKTAKLAAHVGHEISATGKVENNGSTAENNSQSSTMNGSNSGMMGSNNGEMNTPSAGAISLKKFHHIADTCPQ